MLLPDKCPKHNFQYISMPREAGEHSDPDDADEFIAKCPLLTCPHGIRRANTQITPKINSTSTLAWCTGLVAQYFDGH